MPVTTETLHSGQLARNGTNLAPTPALKRAAKIAYLRGEGSIRAISERFNLAFNTVQEWTDKEDWNQLREDYEKAIVERILNETKPATETIPDKILDNTTQAAKLAQVEEQLRAIDEDLKLASPKDKPGLWKAKSMALDAWSLLTGFPRPGVRKQSRPSRSMPDLQPVVSSPEQVQAKLQHDPNEPNG